MDRVRLSSGVVVVCCGWEPRSLGTSGTYLERPKSGGGAGSPSLRNLEELDAMGKGDGVVMVCGHDAVGWRPTTQKARWATGFRFLMQPWERKLVSRYKGPPCGGHVPRGSLLR